MDGHTMEYNSQKDNLIMPEYGRNVQLLVQYTRSIEDPEMRQAFAEKVVELMNQMNPQNRNIEDYRSKLWKHLFHIADYDLDVETPSGVTPIPSDNEKNPQKIEYPHTDSRYRHYGNNIHKLINKAMDMEPGPKRDGFVTVIGSYMKLAYRTWSKEHFVSDETIKSDLISLSNGKLKLSEHLPINSISEGPRDNNNSSGSGRRGRKRHDSNNRHSNRHKGGKRRK